ncbi:unnamed protein product [Lota lota]
MISLEPLTAGRMYVLQCGAALAPTAQSSPQEAAAAGAQRTPQQPPHNALVQVSRLLRAIVTAESAETSTADQEQKEIQSPDKTHHHGFNRPINKTIMSRARHICTLWKRFPNVSLLPAVCTQSPGPGEKESLALDSLILSISTLFDRCSPYKHSSFLYLLLQPGHLSMTCAL